MVAALAGWAVLVTRPRERADGLVNALEQSGARALRFPTIALQALHADESLDAGRYDVIIFVSPAAVEHGSGLLDPVSPAQLATVGPATAAALRERGFSVALESTGSADSEGLLRQPGLATGAIAGRHVLIVRGEGGRAHLGEALVARGAAVDYAAVYRRTRPTGLDPAVADASDMTTVTSNEGVTHLLAMLDNATRDRLLQRPLAVASERNAAHARRLGFTGAIEVATGAGAAAMCAAVERLAMASANPLPGAE